MTSIVVVGHGEKVGTSQTHTGRSANGRRAVKSAEKTDSGRRRQPCNGSTSQQRSDDQLNTLSVRHSSESLDDESGYYVQHVAPILDEMTRCVHGESAHSMRHCLNYLIPCC